MGNVVFPPYGFETYYEVRPVSGGGSTPVGQTGVLIVLGTAVGMGIVGAGYVLIRRRRLNEQMELDE